MMNWLRERLRRLAASRVQRQPSKRRVGVQLRLEELETRLTPSVDLSSILPLANAAPDVQVVPLRSATPAGLPEQTTGFIPQQISQAYGFNQITFDHGKVQGNGAGQTIAIVDAYNDPSLRSDTQHFDEYFKIQGAAGNSADTSFLRIVNQNGGHALPAANPKWGLEESLDVEWAHAMAPGANILLVESKSSKLSDQLTAVNFARKQPGVSVVSMSWGSREWSKETSYDSYFTTPAGHRGVTFVASSGDHGSSGAHLFPSVSPNVLAVGGTQLVLSSTGRYSSETGWHQGKYSSGGGISKYEPQPSYQKGIVTQTSTRRAVPDVAYNASKNSYYIYDSSHSPGGWFLNDGTSAGAPQWVALVAIADQGRALNDRASLDGARQTLPALYRLPSSDFHDITRGSNGSYSATRGYDLVTGRGSPRANKVVSGLVSYGTRKDTRPAPRAVKSA